MDMPLDNCINLKGRCMDNEDDISAKKEIQSQGTRIPGKNEHSRRKKSTGFQKSKGKKKIISVGRIFVAFSSIKNRLDL